MPVTQAGPRIKLECFGCQFHKQEREYDAEADEVDYWHRCTHPDVAVDAAAGKSIGYNAEPPAWCPFRLTAT